MLYVEIVNQSHTIKKGLMFREHLEPNAGMLFQFRHPSIRKFWGLNTYIPLDIAFIDSNGEIVKIAKIKPFCTDGISSEHNCVIAIEANEGYFDDMGIKEGDKIDLSKDDLGFDVVFFDKNKKEK